MFTTISSKLKRHGITHSVQTKPTEALILGKGQVGSQQLILYVIVPYVAAFVLAVIAVVLGGSRLFVYVAIAPAVIGSAGLASIRMKQKVNKFTKEIHRDKIIIHEDTNTQTIVRDDIVKFNVLVQAGEKDGFFGYLDVHLKNGATPRIIGFTSDEAKYMRDDLEYIKKFLAKFMNLPLAEL